MTKKLDVKHFKAMGYLQELNRQFLHPIGLALSVKVDDETGEETLDYIVDSRDDPEGIIFDDSMIDEEFRQRAIAIRFIQSNFAKRRKEALGYVIQPYNQD
jgi:hypothetical protein